MITSRQVQRRVHANTKKNIPSHLWGQIGVGVDGQAGPCMGRCMGWCIYNPPNTPSHHHHPCTHPCTHALTLTPTHAQPGLPVNPNPNLAPPNLAVTGLHYTASVLIGFLLLDLILIRPNMNH